MIGSSHATKSAQPEQSGIVVYAIKDIPEGYEISTDALEERELSYSKIPVDAITSASLAHGRSAKYGIATGQIVSIHDLAPHSDNRSITLNLTDAEYRKIESQAESNSMDKDELVHRWISEKLAK